MDKGQRVDLYHADVRLKTILDKLGKNEKVSDHNREIILSFKAKLKADNVGDKRTVRYLYDIIKFAEYFGEKRFEDTNSTDIDLMLDHLGSLKKSILVEGKLEELPKYTERTMYDYKKSIKRFYKWLYNYMRILPEFKHLPDLNGYAPPICREVTMHKISKLKVTAESVLNLNEVNAMIQAGLDARDRLLVSLLASSGVRCSELAGIRLKDIDWESETIVVTGKTGTRIVAHDSTKYLREYLENIHPSPNNGESFLWVTEKGDNIRSHTWFQRRIKDMAKRAKVQKSYISMHALRHYSASQAAASGANESVMRIQFGWSPTSRTPATYIHLQPKQALQSYRKRVFGKMDKDLEPQQMVVKCKNGHACPLGSVFCLSCGERLVDTTDKEELKKFGEQVKDVKALQEQVKVAELQKQLETNLLKGLLTDPERLSGLKETVFGWIEEGIKIHNSVLNSESGERKRRKINNSSLSCNSFENS